MPVGRPGSTKGYKSPTSAEMAEAQQTASGAILAGALIVLRIAGVIAAFVISLFISVCGSAMMFNMLDCALHAHAIKSGNATAKPGGGFAALGTALGFVGWIILILKDSDSKETAWMNVSRLVTITTAILVCTGTFAAISRVALQMYFWQEQATKKLKAGTEQVELAQPSDSSDLERMVGKGEAEEEQMEGKTDIPKM